MQIMMVEVLFIVIFITASFVIILRKEMEVEPVMDRWKTVRSIIIKHWEMEVELMEVN